MHIREMQSHPFEIKTKNTMKKRLDNPGFILLAALSSSTFVNAVSFGKVDNLFEYILKGQAEKYDKVRPDMKPKGSWTTFKI